jgi:hypothetical protein
MSKGNLYLMFILFIFMGNTYAYLDPGTMTYVVQALVAIVVGGMVAIKTSWSTIKSYADRIFAKEKKTD